jgi:hypothetical protein
MGAGFAETGFFFANAMSKRSILRCSLGRGGLVIVMRVLSHASRPPSCHVSCLYANTVCACGKELTATRARLLRLLGLFPRPFHSPRDLFPARSPHKTPSNLPSNRFFILRHPFASLLISHQRHSNPIASTAPVASFKSLYRNRPPHSPRSTCDSSGGASDTALRLLGLAFGIWAVESRS